MKKFSLFLLLLIAPFFSLSADSQGQKLRLAAVVNKTAITVNDLNNRVKLAILSAGLEPTPDTIEKMKEQMLRTMIEEKLQLQAAILGEIKITDETIDKAITGIEEGNGMPKGELIKTLADNHIPLKTFKDQIRAQLAWREYIAERYMHTLQVSDWELEQEIERQKKASSEPQYHLAEIFLNVDSAEKESQTLQDMGRLVQQLQQGARFSVLAQQFSQSPSAAKGGDMGWVSESSLAPELVAELKQVNPGELSNPIRTAQGYILVGLMDRKLPGEKEAATLDIVQSLLPFPQNVTETQAIPIMQKLEGITKNLKSCAELESVITKAGGKTSHNTNMSLDNFPEGMRKILISLPTNQSSAPMITETGGLVVMICNRKTEEVKEFSRDDALHAIAERRLELLARRELRDLKRAAFIDLRL